MKNKIILYNDADVIKGDNNQNSSISYDLHKYQYDESRYLSWNEKVAHLILNSKLSLKEIAEYRFE